LVTELDAHKLKLTIESVGDEVLDVYLTHIRATIAYFNSSLVDNPEVSNVRDFKNKSVESIKIHSDRINEIIDKKTLEISSLLDDNEILKQTLAASKESLKSLLFNRMMEDAKSVSIDLHKFVIVAKSMQLSGRAKISASIAAKKSIRFTHVDKIGRVWSAKLYVKSLTQQWVVKTIYDSYVLKAIAENGLITLSNGMIFHPLEAHLKEFVKNIHPNTSVFPV
jgi:hypothetical protein